MEAKHAVLKKSTYTSGEYWENNDSLHEEDAIFKVENALKILKRNNIRPTSIVDVGCGSGKHAYLLASEFNVPTIGLDISERSLRYAREQFIHKNLEFLLLPISEWKCRASLGIMFDVFEHIEDYFGFLRQAREKADYWVFNIPLDMTVLSVLRSAYILSRNQFGHLHYFSEKSAIATLEDCGFQLLDKQLAVSVLHRIKTRPTMKGLIAAIPKAAFIYLNNSFGVKLLGGASLVALCKSETYEESTAM